MGKLIHFTAKHPKTLAVVDLFFYSLVEAKRHNPHLVEFRAVEPYVSDRIKGGGKKR